MLAQLTGHTRGFVGLAEIVEAVRGMYPSVRVQRQQGGNKQRP